MKRVSALPLLLGAALAAGCGGDDTGPGGNVRLDDLVGTWQATGLTFVNRSNSSQRVDVIAGGGSANLAVDVDGSYSLVVLEPGAPPDVTSGFAVIESGSLLVTDDERPGVTIAFAVELSGTRLTLVTDEATYDFDDDGTGEPATLTLNLARVTGITVSDLAGVWEATGFRYVSEPAGTDTVDVIVQGGSLSVTITAKGRYEAALAEPGNLPVVETGTVMITGSRLLLIDDDAPEDPAEFTFELIGGSTLELQAEETFDFDDDGTEEPANLEIVLQRQ